MASKTTAPEARITSPPQGGSIYWTAHASLEGDSEPLDPLRFNMYAQRLGDVLVPGITARTVRVRYLGMVCAGLRHTASPGQSIKQRRRAFLPFERGWALAVTLGAHGAIKHQPSEGARSRLRPEYDGFRGANHALRRYREVRHEKRIVPADYLLLRAQEAQGGLGAYLVTLRHFDLVHPVSLDLTATGREMAAAFESATDERLRDLTGTDIMRTRLERAGHDLTVARISASERELGASLLFGGDSGMAEVVRRMRNAFGGEVPPVAQGLEAIADPAGDEIARAARYAVAFDPLRRALGDLFALLGQRLEGRAGAHALGELVDDDVESAGDGARGAARALADGPEIVGLEPVSALARDLASATSLAQLVRSTVTFHRQEGRGWILEQGGDRYAAGQHGAFDLPGDRFHGYTMGSAMRLLADCEGNA